MSPTTTNTPRPARPRPAAGTRTPRATAGPVRRRWPFVLAGVLVVVVLAAGSWVIWFSSLLALRTIDVGGTDQTVASAVRVALAHHEGSPLARIGIADAEAEVRALPEIAEVEVIRQWPDTLVVNVKARTPVAVTAANGALWLLDSSGFAYRQVEAAPAGLVTLELASPGPDDPATAAALTVLGAMTAEFRAQVGAIVAGSPFAVTVNLKDGRVVMWGSADRSPRKMQITPALLEQPGQVFDLSDPDLVTVR